MNPILVVAIFAALAISIYTGLRLFTLMGRIRRESRRSHEVAVRIEEDWKRFSEREKTSRLRALERLESLEEDVKDRVESFEKVALGTRERLVKLERYLKEFFEVELRTVFDSFDKTVASILEEMKVELLRGVDRIEDIQAVVDSKSFAQDRILEGDGSVYRLIAEKEEKRDEAASGNSAGGDAPEPVESKTQEKAESAEPAEPPRFRLEADEAE